MRMPYPSCRIGRLFFCMFWLIFIYPRSHSGWIGPIGEIEAAEFIRERAYRYFINMKEYACIPDALSYSRIGDLFVVCFDWFLYNQVTFRLNWANWRICRSCGWMTINLPVLHPSLSWLALNIKEYACFSHALPYQSDRMTCVLYVLTGFCIIQVIFFVLFACRYSWRKASVASLQVQAASKMHNFSLVLGLELQIINTPASTTCNSML
jgi:hypothetical protein